MTKIFITIPWFLPAFRAGGPVQSIANLIKEYKDGVEYFIFCGDTDVNGAALDNIHKGEWLPFNEHTHVWYAAPEKISDNLVRQVGKIKPDILYIVGMFSWHYNIVPLLYGKVPKKILSSRGMLHPGALSQKKLKKKIYLQLFKLLEYHHKVVFHATDAEEARFICNYFGESANVCTAGNFPNKMSALPMPDKKPGELKLASIALVSPMKNILLVLEALEKVEASIQYNIFGAVKDEDYWDECKRRMRILPGHIKVVFHKEIEPHEVKEALGQTHIFILPSKSENFGHALYEALSAGRPVITSHHTPWNHLQAASAGMNVSLDGTDELTAAINTFAAMDSAALALWHQSAITYAAQAVDVDELRAEYERMFS